MNTIQGMEIQLFELEPVPAVVAVPDGPDVERWKLG